MFYKAIAVGFNTLRYDAKGETPPRTNKSIRKRLFTCVPEAYAIRRNSGRHAGDFVRSDCGSGVRLASLTSLRRKIGLSPYGTVVRFNRISAVRTAIVHDYESLNEPLKQRVSFNFEFPFENSRDVRVRRSKLRACTAPSRREKIFAYALVAKLAHRCCIFES